RASPNVKPSEDPIAGSAHSGRNQAIPATARRVPNHLRRPRRRVSMPTPTRLQPAARPRTPSTGESVRYERPGAACATRSDTTPTDRATRATATARLRPTATGLEPDPPRSAFAAIIRALRLARPGDVEAGPGRRASCRGPAGFRSTSTRRAPRSDRATPPPPPLG